SAKLSHRKVGPYEVIEPIGNQAYRIRIPHAWKCHNVFHVSKLEPYRQSERFPAEQPPEPEDDSGEPAYFVRKIIQCRWNKRRKALEYLVDWEGYEKDQATWEPLDNLLVDDEPIFALEQFRRENPDAESRVTPSH
ncbi:MAG TPA: chromo domain-containing protein, partial [Verrucomicrobiae bacterium]|nr:chromo domain-containing protein [Verrucomicrobiae bacterium]